LLDKRFFSFGSSGWRTHAMFGTIFISLSRPLFSHSNFLDFAFCRLLYGMALEFFLGEHKHVWNL
jgi:hypothetical protein